MGDGGGRLAVAALMGGWVRLSVCVRVRRERLDSVKHFVVGVSFFLSFILCAREELIAGM